MRKGPHISIDVNLYQPSFLFQQKAHTEPDQEGKRRNPHRNKDHLQKAYAEVKPFGHGDIKGKNKDYNNRIMFNLL